MLYSQRHLPQIRTRIQFGLGPSIMRCRSRGAGGRCTVQWTAAALLLLLLLARHRSQSRRTTGGARQLRNKRSNQIITSDSLTDQEKHNDRMGGLYHCLLFFFFKPNMFNYDKSKIWNLQKQILWYVFFFFQSDAISSDRAGSSHPLPLPSPITKGPSLNKPTFCFFNSWMRSCSKGIRKTLLKLWQIRQKRLMVFLLRTQHTNEKYALCTGSHVSFKKFQWGSIYLHTNYCISSDTITNWGG